VVVLLLQEGVVRAKSVRRFELAAEGTTAQFSAEHGRCRAAGQLLQRRVVLVVLQRQARGRGGGGCGRRRRRRKAGGGALPSLLLLLLLGVGCATS
jgi:hypothetical protein